jgi:hypothetical protein
MSVKDQNKTISKTNRSEVNSSKSISERKKEITSIMTKHDTDVTHKQTVTFCIG